MMFEPWADNMAILADIWQQLLGFFAPRLSR